MRHFFSGLLITLALAACGWKNEEINLARPVSTKKPAIYSFTMDSITEEAVPLSQYKGRVILIVNTASKCGLTPQYKDLEALYRKYKDRGLVILGFPANDFLEQEPGSNKKIKAFCELNYGVSFPMFAKIHVKGKAIHPLYRYLTEKKSNGLFDAPVKWNFQKFLIDRKGNLRGSFGPAMRVTDPAIMKMIKKLL